MPDNFENMQGNNINTQNNTSQPTDFKIVPNEDSNEQINVQNTALEDNMNKAATNEQPIFQPQPQAASYNPPMGNNVHQPQYQPPYNPPYTDPNGYNNPRGYNPPYTNPGGYNNPRGYNPPYTNPYGYNPYANGIHNNQPQQGYQYQPQPMQPQYMPPQPPRPQTPPPYQQNYGQMQGDNNAFQNIKQDKPTKQTEKKGMNKGLKVFLIIIISIFGIAVIGLASYGVISLINDIGNQYNYDGDVSQPANPFEDNSSQPANPFENNGGQQINPFDQPNNGSSLPQTQNQPQTNPSKFKLGIVVSPVTDEMQANLNVIPDGLIIIGVEATSSLADADIQPYDIITEVDGQKISTTEQLHEYMDTKKEGDKLKLTIARIDQNNNVEYHEVEAELQVNENYTKEDSTNDSSSKDSSGESSKPSL